MKDSVKESVTVALVHNAIAKKHLEYVKHETEFDTKQFVQRLINRLDANEKDVFNRIGEESKEVFKREVWEADMLQYSHIIIQLLSMTKEERELAEKTIDGMAKGEIIEFTEPSY